MIMEVNKQQIKGLLNKVTGQTKEVIGKALSNDKIASNGNIQKNIGAIQSAIGNAQSEITKLNK